MTTQYTAEDLANHDGIGAVIRNAEGAILMQMHAKFGFWTIPIGKTSPDRILEGLKKEL